MKRVRSVALIVLALVLFGGMTAYAFANAPERGTMGVWGYVVSENNASLEVDEEQRGATTLVVDRAEAPEDAWVVVHLNDDGMPGERVGLTHIDAGVNRDVRVELEDVTTDEVIVAIHADRGTIDEFDFDMEKAEMSPDRPFFVNRMELAMMVSVR